MRLAHSHESGICFPEMADDPESSAPSHEGPRPLEAREARFRALLEDYGRVLRAAIVRVCPRQLGLQFDDIEQDARIRLWRALEREREIEDPASYLYRIAATATLDAIRRVRARREEPLETEPPGGEERGSPPRPGPASKERSPEQVAAERQTVRRIETCLATLPESRRRALGLYLQGFTTTEIGELLGWSEAKARNLAYRALKELRERLRSEGIGHDGG